MYEWIKAAHVACVLLFSGGLVALLVASRAIGARGEAGHEQAAVLRAMVRKWDMWISQPALGGVWAFGIWAAIDGGWFSQPWLQVKLVFVFILSGLHGRLAGKLRRLDLATDPVGKGAPTQVVTLTIMVSLVVVAVLAVAKPF